MWLRFAPGQTEISALQQNFTAEVKDPNAKKADKARHFFRAPTHIAQFLLGLGIGITAEEPSPEAQAGLPEFNATSDAGTEEGLRQFSEQIENLKSDLQLANENITKLMAENTSLQTELDQTTKERDTYQSAGVEAATRLNDLITALNDKGIDPDNIADVKLAQADQSKG
jgi:regulator of replication initiation timing